MLDSQSVYDSFIPQELTTKCWMLVERFHKRAGIGQLVVRISESDNMPVIGAYPPALGLLGSANAAFRYRHYCWLAGAALAIAGVFYNRWVLFGLIFVFVLDRRFARTQYGSYMAIAATLLSLEMLVNDWAAWGTTFPTARQQAESLLASVPKLRPSRWLDSYLPNRAEMDPDLVRSFGPT